MTISGLSIKRPLMMIMVILAISMFGFVSWRNLPIDRMPEMDLPYITVQAVYPGAGPVEIEANVVKPIEDEISTIAGLKHMTSYCLDNVAIIMLQFNDGVDGDFAAIDVKDKIDKILYTLPEELEKPTVSKMDLNAKPIVTLAVTGEMAPDKMRLYVDNNIKDKFAKIDGVSKVEVTGGREREIVVNLKDEALAAHNLTIFQIQPFLSSQNLSLPGGYVTEENREYTARVAGEFDSVQQIKDLEIPAYKQHGERTVPYNLKLDPELATVEDSYKEIRDIAKFNGKEAVQISISKSSDANTANTAKGIKELYEELQSQLPAGLTLSIVEDKSKFIQDSVDDTYSNIYMGIALTALILLLFLFDWRLTVIAGVTMPISLIMAMIGVEALGFTLNMVTMMALTIAVGILVTNSIIVIENIVRHRNMGQSVKKAAEEGSNEIMMSILASTLTNLAVFIPIANTTGLTGAIFKELGLTIVFATVASLILSFTLVPLMAGIMLKEKKLDAFDRGNIMDRFMNKLDKAYEKLLGWILGSVWIRVIIMSATVGLLVFTMKVIAPQLGNEFVAKMDEGYISVSLELPPGTPISTTIRQVEKMEKLVEKTPYLESYSTKIGGSGTNTGVQYADISIKLKEERDMDAFQVIDSIRTWFAEIPDGKIAVGIPSESGSSADIVLEVTGPDLDSLITYAEVVQAEMKQVPNLTDFNSSWKGYKPEILVSPDRDLIHHFGLTPNIQQATTVQMIGGLLRYNITGNDEAIFRENGEDFPIRIQLEQDARNSKSDVENMTIFTPRGPKKLKDIAKVEESDGISSVTRKNRQKMIQLTANVITGNAGDKVAEITERLEKLEKVPGYSFGFSGDQEMMEESNEQMGFAAGLALALTIMVLIALLESIPMGIVIFLTIPLGFIGVVWALFLGDYPISMISSLSVIMLIGIVVNNAILLIDYARHQRQHFGLSPKEAIIMAGGTKLKPIIMSNIAIIVSMIPMALGMGSGGSFRAPFAVTAIGGVLVSTMLTFIVIPILYVLTAPKKAPEEIAGEKRGDMEDV